MAMRIQSPGWKTGTGLRSHALILAKAIDLHTQVPPRGAAAWDLLPSRLEALIHVNRSGGGKVGEALKTPLAGTRV